MAPGPTSSRIQIELIRPSGSLKFIFAPEFRDIRSADFGVDFRGFAFTYLRAICLAIAHDLGLRIALIAYRGSIIVPLLTLYHLPTALSITTQFPSIISWYIGRHGVENKALRAEVRYRPAWRSLENRNYAFAP
jgi:hypothetical protein